jgi:hypothetical protein
MISSANAYLTAAWDRFILLVDQSPRSIFAGILAVLTGLAGIAIVSLFSRLRSLKARNRQLAETVEALSARLEETCAGLDAKISALSADRAREVPAPAPKDNQLAETVETLSARLEETRAGLNAKISALSADLAREAPAPKDKERERPAALMREELVSLQLDLQAPEDRAEAPAIEENT